MYAKGRSGESGCLPGVLAEEALTTDTLAALDEVGLDPEFAVVLTSAVLTCPSIYQLTLENDARGIGFQHTEGSEIFDKAPEHELEGIAFLNDLPYWLESPDELESAFLHEIGHRWLARVHALVGGEQVDLLGRQGGHWSYFLDTGGSPLEGNAWQDEDEPISDSPLFPRQYSPLDLYLMGAYAADEVPEFRLLIPDVSDAVDCTGAPLNSASPPQTCGPLALAGTWLPLTLDDVIAAEGPRVPAASAAPKEFSVAFLLLDPGGADFGVDECQDLADSVEQLIDVFDEATEGRLRLVNVATGGLPCDELQLAPAKEGGCQLHPGSTREPMGAVRLLAVVATLGALQARARRGRSRPAG